MEPQLSPQDQKVFSSVCEAVSKLEATVEDEKYKKDFQLETKNFRALFSRFLEMRSNKAAALDWNKIHPLTGKQLVDYSSLKKCPPERIKGLLDKLVVLKLNGGLGTTMGCKGPKSVIEVREDSTFLDLIVKQIESLNEQYGVNVPLVLMNSFNTDHDTREVISKYEKQNITIKMFNQKKFPRIYKDSLLPVPTTADPNKLDTNHWNPPGHGDVYDSFFNSPIFKEFKEQGKRYVFISNVDNLGASVDVDILNYLFENNIEFCMEVTKKTRADVKGGTLIEYEGAVRLLEIAQCPKDKVEEFKSIKKFKVFNTNNIWVNIPAIESHIQDFTNLDIIVNVKTLSNGKAVIQLETAAGAAIQHFKTSIGINVPRSRFMPVKSCSDLLLVQSNLYSVSHGLLVLNPQRVEKVGDESLPSIKLGDKFQKVSDYMERFVGIPNILELESLTVSGDVTFGPNVTLKGSVVIVAQRGDKIEIPPGSIIENKVVTGCLRME